MYLVRLASLVAIFGGVVVFSQGPVSAMPATIDVERLYVDTGKPTETFGAPGERWFETVKATATAGSVTATANVYAGRFRLKSDAPAESGLSAFDAFCIDFLGILGNPPGLYHVGGSVFDDGAGGAEATEARLAGFWNANFAKVTDSRSAAAFQIGLWEAKYDDSFSLTNGRFKVISANSATRNLVTGWLGALQTMLDNGSADTTPRFVTLASKDGNGQDLLSPVPLPAAAWLLAAAVGGLGLLGRRRAV
jgi:hypothetical protein